MKGLPGRRASQNVRSEERARDRAESGDQAGQSRAPYGRERSARLQYVVSCHFVGGGDFGVLGDPPVRPAPSSDAPRRKPTPIRHPPSHASTEPSHFNQVSLTKGTQSLLYMGSCYVLGGMKSRAHFLFWRANHHVRWLNVPRIPKFLGLRCMVKKSPARLHSVEPRRGCG